MSANEMYDYVQRNRKEMPKERMAVALMITIHMVNHYLYNYIPREPKVKVVRERVRNYNYKETPVQCTDFETNGFFDVDKWAICLHV